MELSQNGFLEELLQGPRIRDINGSTNSNTWFQTSTSNELFTNGWNLDSFDENAENPCSFLGFSSSSNEPAAFDCSFNDQTYPFFNGFTCGEIDDHSTVFAAQEDYPSMVEHEELSGLLLRSHSFDERLSSSSCKVELEQGGCNSNNGQVFNMGLCADKKTKSKKLEGQPSKNLMAERRRRKRLNDRLSMLRSIVPKISKMDRTSILGDTIDYMKELLERINKLQEEASEEGTSEITLMTNFNEISKPNEVLVRNSPKFNIERREGDTRIDICCSAKPGLLLSTVNTLEALGLEIQQCVISCFNDFSMQASCSEADEQRKLASPEDIKQALFRTAGYGGRCL